MFDRLGVNALGEEIVINDSLSDKQITEQLVQLLEIAVGTKQIADKIVKTLGDNFQQDTESARVTAAGSELLQGLKPLLAICQMRQ